MLKKARLRLRRILLAGAATLTLAATSTIATPTTPAEAAVEGFNPGNIISDTLFYDGNAMTVAEIQTFLNQRVPRCTIGDPGREAGSPWGNTHIAEKCLRDFTMNTVSLPTNSYCATYVGQNGETAAQIIAKVAQACGISPRVLLVTLEKEQSLVTDTWPTVRQLAVATGYACPDSGPNWAANCNPQYYGFQNQVYYAAWQFKVYKAHPNSYNYKPFQTNTIQWNPNPDCGTSQVYIENWATAGLYIYTPYRPNQAALDAGWGLGDACSSYGNRNFYNLFNNWFGTPVVETHDEIDAKYADNSFLGAATSGYNSNDSNGGGVVRGYQNGVITWQTGAAEAFVMSGTIRQHYSSHALGLDGPLGWPTSDAVCSSLNNCVQTFQHGTIQTNQGRPSIEIPDITEVAAAESVTLGPVRSTPMGQTVNGGGFVQGHTNGAITWNANVGAVSIQGPIRTTYGLYGGVSGSLGWPSSPANYSESNGGGYVQGFQNGAITSSAAGTYVLTGIMRSAYGAQGGLNGTLGWPASNANTISANGGGQVQAFENGALTLRNGSDTPILIDGEFRRVFGEAGGIAGRPGWPTSEPSYYDANGGGWVQGFQNAAILSSDDGTYLLGGSWRSAFGKQGGVNGSLGWPTSSAYYVSANGGGQLQTFQNGALAARSGSSEPVLVIEDFYQVLEGAGGVSGDLGWPTSPANYYDANGGGHVQGFQNAAILSSASGTYTLSGAMRAAFGAQGGINGDLGWPTAPATCTASICTQEFENGSLTVGE